MLAGLNGGVEASEREKVVVCVSACMCWLCGFMCVSSEEVYRHKGRGCMESRQTLRETVNKETSQTNQSIHTISAYIQCFVRI